MGKENGDKLYYTLFIFFISFSISSRGWGQVDEFGG